MEIFRGKKPRRGRRAQERQRQDSRRRKSAAAYPLSDLVGKEKRAASATGGTHRKTKRDSAGPSISLVHIAFLLTGLALGAGLLLSLNALLKWHNALDQRVQEAEEAQAQAEATPVQTAPLPPAPHPAGQGYQATSPVEAVRVMLKASYAGDKDTAYDQWDIEPHEMATLVSGQTVTLAELTTKAGEFGRNVRLEDFQFTMQSQSGDQATVAQKREGAVMQVYSLHRRGPYWKIRFAARP